MRIGWVVAILLWAVALVHDIREKRQEVKVPRTWGRPMSDREIAGALGEAAAAEFLAFRRLHDAS